MKLFGLHYLPTDEKLAEMYLEDQENLKREETKLDEAAKMKAALEEEMNAGPSFKKGSFATLEAELAYLMGDKKTN
jgi:hypothetical protein